MKRFVTIGLGNFGCNLGKTLEENNCEVLGIDISQEAVKRASNLLTKTVIANAANRETLESLKLKNFDGAIVSLGQDMSSSILISLYLKEIGIKRIIVRAVSDDHGEILKRIGITEVVFPETAMAVRLGKRLSNKNAVDYLPLGEHYSIIEVLPAKQFIGKTLAEMNFAQQYKCQVVALKIINRQSVQDIVDEGKIIIPPSGSDIITEDTIMVLIGKDSDLNRIPVADD
jgi:trk system potassium uptake protein